MRESVRREEWWCCGGSFLRRRRERVRRCDWWSEGWKRRLKKEKKRKIWTTSIWLILEAKTRWLIINWDNRTIELSVVMLTRSIIWDCTLHVTEEVWKTCWFLFRKYFTILKTSTVWFELFHYGSVQFKRTNWKIVWFGSDRVWTELWPFFLLVIGYHPTVSESTML